MHLDIVMDNCTVELSSFAYNNVSLKIVINGLFGCDTS